MATLGSNTTALGIALQGYNATAISPIPPPSCDIHDSGLTVSPATWVSLNMDTYLADIAEASGLANKSGNYLVNLMEVLGWSGYTCTTDNALCAEVPLTTCSSLLNYQVAGFQGYMKNIENILDDVLVHIDNNGYGLFENLWAPQPPPGPEFNGALFKDIISAVLGFVPIVGNIAKAVVIPLLDATVLKPAATTTITPNYQLSWANFISHMADSLTFAKGAIYNQSRNATQSSSGIASFSQEGPWFIPDNSGDEYRPDVAEVWPNLSPYFMSRVAMQGLAAQEVFFVSAPVSVLASSSQTCTQSIADQFAAVFPTTAKSKAGIAWCVGQQVVVPVVGYDMALYTPWPTLLSKLGISDPNEILSPSGDCYSGFGVTTNDIALYNLTDLEPVNPNTPHMTYDLTVPCAWAVPICDYGVFSNFANTSGYPSKNGYQITKFSGPEALMNVAGYCAYNFNMMSQIKFCGQFHEWVDYDGWGEYEWIDTCVNWNPTKKINVL